MSNSEHIPDCTQKEYKELLASVNILEGEHIKPLLRDFLNRHPNYPPALRLQGILLEQEVSEELSQGFDIPSYDGRKNKMCESFEAALQSDPQYVLALIDLGDYWKDYGEDCTRAVLYYDRAISLLKGGHFTENQSAEIKDAYAQKIDALLDLGEIDEAESCRLQALEDCKDDRYFKELKI